MTQKITLEESDWLSQEYKSWIDAGKPGGWSSGWVKGEEVLFELFRWQPNITILGDGEILFRLRPIGGRV